MEAPNVMAKLSKYLSLRGARLMGCVLGIIKLES